MRPALYSHVAVLVRLDPCPVLTYWWSCQTWAMNCTYMLVYLWDLRCTRMLLYLSDLTPALYSHIVVRQTWPLPYFNMLVYPDVACTVLTWWCTSQTRPLPCTQMLMYISDVSPALYSHVDVLVRRVSCPVLGCWRTFQTWALCCTHMWLYLLDVTPTLYSRYCQAWPLPRTQMRVYFSDVSPELYSHTGVLVSRDP